MSHVAGELSPWQLTEGSSAPRAGEVVVDQASADTGDLRSATPVTVLTQTGPHEFLARRHGPVRLRRLARAAPALRSSTSPPPSRCCSAGPTRSTP